MFLSAVQPVVRGQVVSRPVTNFTEEKLKPIPWRIKMGDWHRCLQAAVRDQVGLGSPPAAPAATPYFNLECEKKGEKSRAFRQSLAGAGAGSSGLGIMI